MINIQKITMNKIQKTIFCLVGVFLIINIFLIPIIGLKNLKGSSYFPYVVGYLIAVVFFVLAAIFIKKRQ